jgi:hypothetical protein
MDMPFIGLQLGGIVAEFSASKMVQRISPTNAKKPTDLPAGLSAYYLCAKSMLPEARSSRV